MEQPGLCSENQCKLWCVTPSCNLGEVKVLSCLLKQCNCVPGGLNNIQSCRPQPAAWNKWDKAAGWIGLSFTGCYGRHVLCLQEAKSSRTSRTHSKVQVDPCNDQKGVDKEIWGDNLCFFRCVAVKHEGVETSSSLVSVKDTTCRRSPPQQ